MFKVVITDSDFGVGEVEAAELGLEYSVRFLGERSGTELLDGIADADVLMVQWAMIDGSVMDAAPSLKGIVRFGMGLDNIDLVAAAARGIDVRNVDDFCLDEVADHAVAMIVSSNRRLWLADRAVKQGQWGPSLVPPPPPPAEAPVGIAGLGRIGRGVAEKLHALGYPILYWDSSVASAPTWADRVDTLIELASMSKFITLHIPLSEHTRGIVSAEVIAALGPDGYLINVGRGGLVDEAALLTALDTGGVEGACLDVLMAEPPAAGASSALSVHPKVLATPHVAYLSTRAIETLRRNAAGRVRRILE